MADVGTLTLRDSLRNCMRKTGDDVSKIARIIGCSDASIYGFLAGITATPREHIRDGIEGYLISNGMDRNSITKLIAGKKKPPVIQYLAFAMKIVLKMIEDGRTTQNILSKEAGLPKGSMTHLLHHSEYRKLGTNAKKILAWLEEKHGITVDKLNQMMVMGNTSLENSPNVIEEKDDDGNMVLRAPKKKILRYICAQLDDWDVACLIASIMEMESDHLSSEGKRNLLAKMFPRIFTGEPTS